jgi:hypothetical protein
MSRELIRDWLQLTSDAWPPAPHDLLGLPTSAGPEQIEQRVLERLELVRRHQLAEPESATEAMTLLAQAFVALTPPVPAPVPVPKVPKPAPVAEANAVTQGDGTAQVAWSNQVEPPPVRREVEPPAEKPIPYVPPLSAAEGETEAETIPLAPMPEPVAGTFDPVAPLVEAASSSLEARSGLGTRRALHQRLRVTRQLLEAWDAAGDYLGQGDRRLTRRAAAADLVKQLARIRRTVPDFPNLLGRAGQPGYLVVALTRQANIAPTFQMLLPSQREELARDWRAGRAVLRAHRRFLRDELRALRRKGVLGRAHRGIKWILLENAGLVLVVLGIVALLIALGLNAIIQARRQRENAEPVASRWNDTRRAPSPETRRNVSSARPENESDTKTESEPVAEPEILSIAPRSIVETPLEHDPMRSEQETVPGKPGQAFRVFAAHRDAINAVDIAQNKRGILSGGSDKTVWYWDRKGGREAVPLQLPFKVRSVIFTPDSHHAVIAGDSNELIGWDIDSLKSYPIGKVPHGWLRALAISPDGTLLASAGEDKLIRLWNLESRTELRRLEGHTKSVLAVAFSPDGHFILSGGADHSVRL